MIWQQTLNTLTCASKIRIRIYIQCHIMNGSESDTKRSNNPLDVDLWKTLWLFVKWQVRILTGVDGFFLEKKPQPPLVHPHSPHSLSKPLNSSHDLEINEIRARPARTTRKRLKVVYLTDERSKRGRHLESTRSSELNANPNATESIAKSCTNPRSTICPPPPSSHAQHITLGSFTMSDFNFRNVANLLPGAIFLHPCKNYRPKTRGSRVYCLLIKCNRSLCTLRGCKMWDQGEGWVVVGVEGREQMPLL